MLVDQFRKLVSPHDGLILANENGAERPAETLALLARLGVVDGIPDLQVLFARGQSLWVEVKLETSFRGYRTRTSAAQDAVHMQLLALGHRLVVVRDSAQFWAAIDHCGIPHGPPPPLQLALFGQGRQRS